MLHIETGPDDVAASRFAVSPAGETARLVTVLTGPSWRALPGLGARLRDAFSPLARHTDVRLLAYLNAPPLGADFSSPPPASMAQTIEQDAEVVRSTPLATVRSEVAQILAQRPAPLDLLADLDDPGLADRVADALLLVWHTVLAPEWPRIFTVLQRDVRYRADRLTDSGWAAALGGIHERVSWHDGEIRIQRFPETRFHLGGRGLLLVPSVFVAPSIAFTSDEPWQPSIVYPARGIGTLDESLLETDDALARLLGAGRARILVQLSESASTTHLTLLTGGSLGGVGDHLSALLAAGLVTRDRAGRSVLYRRSPLGDALVRGSLA